ncbi:MAG: D-alanine--D-alanine ligase [Alphaproteobacteria bacterium]|nr:D-alanine--D-alanine ligase [Alphaproteobacteria bacterium]
MVLDVALLVGGWSAEREVSLEKGIKVEKALTELGYNLRVIDVQKDIPALMKALTPKPDVVFNNLHGTGGEDGVIQGVLEMLDIPYTHSNVCASAIAMDKPRAKALASTVGVPSPKGQLLSKEEYFAQADKLTRPFVIKPPCEGSSVGVYIIREGDNRSIVSEENWCFGEAALVEDFIAGRELTIAVLDGEPQAVTEIISKTDFFDYEAKYQDQSTEYIMPAKIPESIYTLALDYAQRVYNIVGCSGLARCDFRYDESRGENGLYLLEINTQPGLTPESIGPSQVIYNGTSFNALCAHLIETALCHKKENTKVKSLKRKVA